MKISRNILLFVSLLAIGCSSDDENAEGDQSGEANLEIIDYSPKQTFTAEEVTIQLQTIDTTKAIEVLFSGIQSPSLEKSTTEIKARVPSGAESGDIIIRYEGIETNVGAIEITHEEATIYVYVQDEVSSFNIAEGVLNEFIIELPSEYGEGGVGNVMYTSTYNALYSQYCILCGTSGCSCHGSVRNLENGMGAGIFLSGDLGEPYLASVMGLTEESLFYIVRDIDLLSGQETRILKRINLETMQSELIWDFVQQGELSLPYKPVGIGDLLVGYKEVNSNFKYRIFNLNTFETIEFDATNISSLKVKEDGTLYGINSQTKEIVILDSQNGEVLETVFQAEGNIRNVFYSESTMRYFWMESQGSGDNYSTTLKILNPSNDIVTSIVTNPVISGIFLDN